MKLNLSLQFSTTFVYVFLEFSGLIFFQPLKVRECRAFAGINIGMFSNETVCQNNVLEITHLFSIC